MTHESAFTNYPQLNTTYFFLGNSYDQMYKPAKQGDPANDALIQKAIENYRKAADKNTRPGLEEVSSAVSVGGVRLRQAQRPGQG